MWRHIDFYFNTKYKNKAGKYDKYLNPKQQIIFERCLANIITDCRKFIKRKFYLYEPKPHSFLAVEVKSIAVLKFINQIVKEQIEDLNFIKSARINYRDSKDESNGEDFLIILNAFTDAYLFYRQTRLTHIIHCCMEFIHQTRDKELEFYNKMLALYGGEEYR